ncbi:WXG100 family type VII secretion target [Mycobacteroides abscessus]|uniref:WXG100 family type VII secretion target n=1 Tax=Mycobacteroides abscessus TaxID=36809 RepID=UPI00210853BF|nr:WXG100 family type VII secretion target [Mycobacteroides abscessus]
MARSQDPSGRYTFDAAELDELEADVKRWVTRASESLTTVEKVIAELSDSTVWSGEANEAYQARHQDWVRKLEELRDSASDMAEWTNTASTAYRKVIEINLGLAGQGG